MSEAEVDAEVHINALKTTVVFTSEEMYSPDGWRMRKISTLVSQEEFAVFEQHCKERGYKKSTLIAKRICDRLIEERRLVQRQLFVSNEKASQRSA